MWKIQDRIGVALARHDAGIIQVDGGSEPIAGAAGSLDRERTQP